MIPQYLQTILYDLVIAVLQIRAANDNLLPMAENGKEEIQEQL